MLRKWGFSACRVVTSLAKDPNTNLDFNIEIEYVTKPNGNVLLILQGYTYARANKSSYYWNCSSRQRGGCKARLRIDNSLRITHKDLKHNHNPPNYEINEEGRSLFRIKEAWSLNGYLSQFWDINKSTVFTDHVLNDKAAWKQATPLSSLTKQKNTKNC
ncbi:jg8386 [Pararge aegeria aegeria]|uniref:Jg8386 protein n=1 Tax=Pararge aegeria aegeria TaxID=348720 RepID=A0A8S4SI22_9NEOP|nr:jg8386 [Pararge aegeria aegeria]